MFSTYSPDQAPLRTLPNATTLAGYACGVAWLCGAGPWFAVFSILADELDGRLARHYEQTSEFGSNLDWACDMGLTTATAIKLGGIYPIAAPAMLAYQAWLRTKGERPMVGSARALLMLRGLI